ncbi:MAG: TetR/AcrR family transcriptional regulator [Spirochaetaceae bacterium]|nr:TetR/AcrR family transcriptional regulator [Spirochaetaceae bacterium]
MGRREEQTEKTKAAIMENALRLFREKGYDSVSVEQITRAAGVAKGTFYTYFETKSDIIVEEFWKIDRYYQEYAARNLRRYKRPADKLMAFTRAQMRYVRDEVGVDSLKILYTNQILGSGGEREKVIVDPKRQWYRIIETIMAEGQAEGSFRSDIDASELAQVFNRSMRSVFLDWCIADGAFDLVKEGLKYCEEWVFPALYHSVR